MGVLGTPFIFQGTEGGMLEILDLSTFHLPYPTLIIPLLSDNALTGPHRPSAAADKCLVAIT